jgi:hypothetical protein
LHISERPQQLQRLLIAQYFRCFATYLGGMHAALDVKNRRLGQGLLGTDSIEPGSSQGPAATGMPSFLLSVPSIFNVLCCTHPSATCHHLHHYGCRKQNHPPVIASARRAFDNEAWQRV